MANPSAFDARFPFAGKILTVDWTSDEEDGPEDANGRTFVVKRPSFRSNEFIALKYSSFERANSGQLYGNTDITVEPVYW
ncbi:hypothetical protein G6F55_014108 [Rhizopus delemar]|nr:hypothetical protein G6F55_014108 [Rhizopus delemar]KAG1485032.1 hypothetical protein G6F54_013395 [Rhizopus delemar]KAG1606614.1 hypothetical protein G6F45_013942 [Rhizopus arrhizus]